MRILVGIVLIIAILAWFYWSWVTDIDDHPAGVFAFFTRMISAAVAFTLFLFIVTSLGSYVLTGDWSTVWQYEESYTVEIR